MTNLMTNFQTTIDVNLLKSADRNLLSNINYAQNGLYNPAEEHDSCGIGMAVDIKLCTFCIFNLMAKPIIISTPA
jgi:hypothetical protein